MALFNYKPEIGSTTKTYTSEANAVKAVELKYKDVAAQLTYFIYPVDVKGVQRYVPVFVGERAIQHGVHFHFHVVG